MYDNHWEAISKGYLNSSSNEVITLDPKLEQLIIDSVKNEAGTYIAIEPEISNKIVARTAGLAEKMAQSGKQPIILASPVVRLYFKRLTEHAIPGLQFCHITDWIQV